MDFWWVNHRYINLDRLRFFLRFRPDRPQNFLQRVPAYTLRNSCQNPCCKSTQYQSAHENAHDHVTCLYLQGSLAGSVWVQVPSTALYKRCSNQWSDCCTSFFHLLRKFISRRSKAIPPEEWFFRPFCTRISLGSHPVRPHLQWANILCLESRFSQVNLLPVVTCQNQFGTTHSLSRSNVGPIPAVSSVSRDEVSEGQ